MKKQYSNVSPELAMKHLLELISDVKVAMLTTEAQDGHLRSRPM